MEPAPVPLPDSASRVVHSKDDSVNPEPLPESPLPEHDRVNLSRDDSEIGGEYYFLRGTPPTTTTTLTPTTLRISPLSEQRGHPTSSIGHFPYIHSSARLPSRFSSGSLYGEDIDASGDAPGRTLFPNHRKPSGRSVQATAMETAFSSLQLSDQNHQLRHQHSEHVLEPIPIRSSAINGHTEVWDSLSSPPSFNVHQPFLRPQFRSSRDDYDDFESLSDSSIELEDQECNLLDLTPTSFSNGDVDGNSIMTPPSVQYPPSLSPPPLLSSHDGSQQQHQSSHHRHASPPQSHHHHPLPRLIKACSSSRDRQMGSASAPKAAGCAFPAQKRRPPRVPNVSLRFHQHGGGGGGGSSSHASAPNVTSSMSSLHNSYTHTTAATSSSTTAMHSRGHSSGDVSSTASILSALTDSDYEGGAWSERGGSVTGSGRGITASGGVLLSQPSWPEQCAKVNDGDVRGMRIDIPSFLQQPILADDLDECDAEAYVYCGVSSSGGSLKSRPLGRRVDGFPSFECALELPELTVAPERAPSPLRNEDERSANADNSLPLQLNNELHRLRIAKATFSG